MVSKGNTVSTSGKRPQKFTALRIALASNLEDIKLYHRAPLPGSHLNDKKDSRNIEYHTSS
jgi:hypothetical protein